jgi:hypothetical protein
LYEVEINRAMQGHAKIVATTKKSKIVATTKKYRGYQGRTVELMPRGPWSLGQPSYDGLLYK